MNDLSIDCMRETNLIVDFIKETFKEKGFNKAIIGLSGGLDSAIVGKLTVMALGKENVVGIFLPYGNQKDITDSYAVGDFLNIQCHEFNIKPMVDSFGLSGLNEQVRVGNLKARVRMIFLYDLSVAYNALVVGTGNKTELMLGYFTLHGDGACALEPIGHLYKTQVRQLARYLPILLQIIDKAPSAGLWEGQTDEEDLGASYEYIDEALYYLFDADIKLLNEDKVSFKERVVEMVEEKIEKNKFKSELPKMIGG